MSLISTRTLRSERNNVAATSTVAGNTITRRRGSLSNDLRQPSPIRSLQRERAIPATTPCGTAGTATTQDDQAARNSDEAIFDVATVFEEFYQWIATLRKSYERQAGRIQRFEIDELLNRNKAGADNYQLVKAIDRSRIRFGLALIKFSGAKFKSTFQLMKITQKKREYTMGADSCKHMLDMNEITVFLLDQLGCKIVAMKDGPGMIRKKATILMNVLELMVEVELKLMCYKFHLQRITAGPPISGESSISKRMRESQDKEKKFVESKIATLQGIAGDITVHVQSLHNEDGFSVENIEKIECFSDTIYARKDHWNSSYKTHMILFKTYVNPMLNEFRIRRKQLPKHKPQQRKQ